MADPMPRHPFWCECGGKAPFTIKGFQIEHRRGCRHRGESETAAERLFDEAAAWRKRNPGQSIPAPAAGDQ